MDSLKRFELHPEEKDCKLGCKLKKGDFDDRVKNEWIFSKRYNMQMRARTHTHRHPRNHPFLSVLSESKVDKRWQQPKYPSTDEWINKTWCILHWTIMQPCQGSKFWHMLGHGPTLKTLCYKISQSQKDKLCMIPLSWGGPERQKGKGWCPGTGGGGLGSSCLMGTNFSFTRWRVPNTDAGTVPQAWECAKCHWTVHWKWLKW